MKKGFTLVELLVVIAILAILVLISIPRFVKIFGDGEKKIFVNNAITITDEVIKDYVIDDIKGQIIGDVVTSFDDSKVELDGVIMDYYIELGEEGKMENIIMSNGEYCIESITGKDGIVEEKVTDGECPTITFLKEGSKKVTYYNNTFYLGSKDDIIPLIVSNKSEEDIILNVSFGSVELTGNESVKKGEVKLIKARLTEDLYNSMKKDMLYKLQVNMKSPVNIKNTDVISIVKGKPDISIESITSSKGSNNFEYNNGVMVMKNPVHQDVLTVKIKNNSKATLKFANINGNDVIVEEDKLTLKMNTDSGVKHTPSIDLSKGLYLSSNEEMTFNITYDVSKSYTTEFLQVFDFEFKTHFNPGIINDGSITIASSGNATSSTYGDFDRSNEENVDNFQNNAKYFDVKDAYYDNGGYYTYGSNGELLLDENNAIGILNIDQSMGVKDEYSIYMTFKANTNQRGEPSGNEKGSIFSAAMLAISEDTSKYLSWIGLYYNYLNVYSYRNGGSMKHNSDYTITSYSSFYIGDRNNKTTNIQVTAKRGGKTKVYINGELRKTFNSGSSVVNYKFATLGDLRPTRGLKYNGAIYDVAVYNKVLNEDEILHNWNYSKNAYSITE